MIEALRLTVRNGVRLVMLGDHDDCAAKDATESPAGQDALPEIAHELTRMPERYRALVEHPEIRRAIEDGRLLVVRVKHHTDTQRLDVLGELRPPPAGQREPPGAPASYW
jgi:hypothetical protein